MKYIILKDSNGKEFPVIFPDALVHKNVAEYMQHLLVMEQNTDSEVVAAGFCAITAECHGESESLSVKSRPTDSLALSYSDSISGTPIEALPPTVLTALKKRAKMKIFKCEQQLVEFLEDNGNFELVSDDGKNRMFMDKNTELTAIVTQFMSSPSIFVTIQDQQGEEVEYND